MNFLAAALAAFTMLTPPAGRPPIGPLERYEPRIYDVSFDVTVATVQTAIASDRLQYELQDTPIAMPIIFMGAYSRVDPDSLRGQLWLNNREKNPRLELKPDQPHNTHLAVLTVDSYRGVSLRWQVSFQTQVWSSRIDDAQAARIAWPTEWPAEVQDALKPQMYIESDDPIFAETIQRISKGKLRMVPPYLAAKDIIRYCINEVQTFGDGMERGEFGILRGMIVYGARHAAKHQHGSPHDLVCVCIAMLRAAGIPARPVIGIQKNEHDKVEFVSWGEFYLPDCGWIPFDPFVMRGKGIRTMDVRKPWPEFGAMRDLNRRIPLAYNFMPAATVESPRLPAVWGWDLRQSPPRPSDQWIRPLIVSRGRGVEDPQ